MGLAPVVIFTYNRYEETMQTLRSLSKNDLAKDTDVFVFSNAADPGSEEDKEKIRRLRMYLKRFQGNFGSYTVVERDKNLGANDNMMYGIQEIVDQYGRVIVLEDDIVTARGFLRFMNQALDTYREDPDVFSICGYNPVSMETILPGDSFSYDAFRSWGWGIWADRWNLFSWDEDTLSQIDLRKARQEGLMYITTIRYDIIHDRYNEAIRYLDYKLACKQMALGKTVLYPKKSLCDNIGIHGNGLTCLEIDSVNLNYEKEFVKNDYDLSKEKLTIISDPDYFFEFRWQEFSMDIYFEINFNREFLYKTMYYTLTELYFHNCSIVYFFKKYGYKKIAIYGWGEAGMLLYEILKDSEINVSFLLDRTAKKRTPVPLYQDFTSIPKADVIIVTAIRDFMFIEQKLSCFTDIPVICMDDIVLECKVDLLGNKGR